MLKYTLLPPARSPSIICYDNIQSMLDILDFYVAEAVEIKVKINAGKASLKQANRFKNCCKKIANLNLLLDESRIKFLHLIEGN